MWYDIITKLQFEGFKFQNAFPLLAHIIDYAKIKFIPLRCTYVIATGTNSNGKNNSPAFRRKEASKNHGSYWHRNKHIQTTK